MVTAGLDLDCNLFYCLLLSRLCLSVQYLSSRGPIVSADLELFPCEFLFLALFNHSGYEYRHVLCVGICE